MAPSTTPTPRTRAGSTASGACTSGSTGRRSAATKPATGGAVTTSTTASDRKPAQVTSTGTRPCRCPARARLQELGDRIEIARLHPQIKTSARPRPSSPRPTGGASSPHRPTRLTHVEDWPRYPAALVLRLLTVLADGLTGRTARNQRRRPRLSLRTFRRQIRYRG